MLSTLSVCMSVQVSDTKITFAAPLQQASVVLVWKTYYILLNQNFYSGRGEMMSLVGAVDTCDNNFRSS